MAVYSSGAPPPGVGAPPGGLLEKNETTQTRANTEIVTAKTSENEQNDCPDIARNGQRMGNGDQHQLNTIARKEGRSGNATDGRASLAAALEAATKAGEWATVVRLAELLANMTGQVTADPAPAPVPTGARSSTLRKR